MDIWIHYTWHLDPVAHNQTITSLTEMLLWFLAAGSECQGVEVGRFAAAAASAGAAACGAGGPAAPLCSRGGKECLCERELSCVRYVVANLA